jgi:hypothetical protein
MSFSVDTRGLVSYGKTLRDAARRINWATAFYLTELAVHDREAQLDTIEATMTIRDKRFAERHMVWDKANGRTPAAAQVARSGSREDRRFTGWREQVEGGDKARVAMPKGRTGGKRAGKMLGRVRLKQANKFLTQHSIPIRAKSEAHRAFVFLQIMSRRAKTPFVLASGGGLQPGVWTLEGRHGRKAGRGQEKGDGLHPRQLQEFGADKPVQRNDWNAAALALLKRRVDHRALWKRMWDKAGVLPKRKVCK